MTFTQTLRGTHTSPAKLTSFPYEHDGRRRPWLSEQLRGHFPRPFTVQNKQPWSSLLLEGRLVPKQHHLSSDPR